MRRAQSPPAASLHLVPLVTVLTGLLVAPAAAEDVVARTRSRFPERPWSPITAADAALAGAGRASDPASGWSVNPALVAAAGKRQARATGIALDPERSDVKASTQRYSDASPQITFGEAGLTGGAGPLIFGLYLTHDAYDQAHESFLDTTAGQAPSGRDNEFLSTVDRAGLALAWAHGRVAVGAAVEVSRPLEHLVTVPSEDSQNTPPYPEPVDLRYQGLAVGGAAGVFTRPRDWLAVGASARVASSTDLEIDGGRKLGRDEIAPSADIGVRLGSGAGGNLLLAASYRGPRDVTLGDTLGRGVERDPRRVRVSAGYAYRSGVLPWEFRFGLGWSPYPGGGAPRHGLFGIGLGYRMTGSVARISYAREGRRTPDGDTASRAFVVLGLDVRF